MKIARRRRKFFRIYDDQIDFCKGNLVFQRVKSRKFSACGGLLPPHCGGEIKLLPPPGSQNMRGQKLDLPPLGLEIWGGKNSNFPPRVSEYGGEKISKFLFPPHNGGEKQPLVWYWLLEAQSIFLK